VQVCYNDPTLYGKVAHTPFTQQADITIRTNFHGTKALTQVCPATCRYLLR